MLGTICRLKYFDLHEAVCTKEKHNCGAMKKVVSTGMDMIASHVIESMRCGLQQPQLSEVKVSAEAKASARFCTTGRGE